VFRPDVREHPDCGEQLAAPGGPQYRHRGHHRRPTDLHRDPGHHQEGQG